MRLKWRNVPVPEAHVAGLLLGAALQIVLPPRFRLAGRFRHAVGQPLLLSGVILSLWAAIQAGDTELSAPDTLVTHGPYALSRNPMCVGWTLMYLGIGFAANAVWVLALLPTVVVYTHLLEIRPEEAWLERQFGDRYRRRVPRYL